MRIVKMALSLPFMILIFLAYFFLIGSIFFFLFFRYFDFKFAKDSVWDFIDYLNKLPFDENKEVSKENV